MPRPGRGVSARLRLLGVETGSDACSVALYVDGDVREKYQIAPRRHAALLLPMIENLLSEAGLGVEELDGFALGRGPGSFTGVRIAAAAVQGMAFATDRPVVCISSLAALAQGALRERGATRVLAGFDARMGEVYWGAFRAENDLMSALQEECVIAPEQAPVPGADGDWLGVGGAFGAYETVLGTHCRVMDPQALPRARDLMPLAVDAWNRGEAVAADQALPVYLRDKVAWKKKSS